MLNDVGFYIVSLPCPDFYVSSLHQFFNLKITITMEESNERFYVERFRVPKEKEACCFITVNQVTGILNQDSNLHFTDQEVMKSMTVSGHFRHVKV